MPHTFDPNDLEGGGLPLLAANLAGPSYKTQLEIEAGLVELGYTGTDVLFLRHPLCSCFVLRWGSLTAVAFKGTTNWREHLNNFNVWPQVTNYGRIHAGVLHTANSFGPNLYSVLYPDIMRGAKIVLTGHSRGGRFGNIVRLCPRNEQMSSAFRVWFWPSHGR